ncbi:hypothetical protein LEN26_020481 [Aphanomyces euteiches]|nr:hypothetical protein LEN26_020481 [Aphanomyces euteiches]
MSKSANDSEVTYQGLASPTTASASSWRDKPMPIATTNWLSWTLLLWFDPLVWKGARQQLEESDVWHLPPADTAAALHSRFESVQSSSCFRAIVRTFQREITIVLALYAVSAVLTLAQPIVIKSFLQFLHAPRHDDIHTDLGISSGYVLAALLTAFSCAAVTLMDLGMVLAGKLGCNAKTLAMDLVFRKSLRLSENAKRTTSSGDIVTLASVDSTRLFMCGLWFMWTFISPVMLVAIFILLGFDLGALPALLGGVLMIGLLYFGCREASAVGIVQKELLGVQGQRVKLTNELLQGVRAVKLYGWEQDLLAHVEELRAAELQLLRVYHSRRQVSSIALLLAPVVSLALTLAVYVAQGNSLSPPLAFITLAYVNAARVPCSSFSFSIMNLVDALHSCSRLDAFFALDEVTTPLLLDNGVHADMAPCVELMDASFSWHKDDSTAACDLRGITLQLKPKSLTMVVGSVGSGKSTLLSAIMGELHHIQGERGVRGRFSYVGQDVWIQNASLRDNILFTSAFDESLYHRVVAACQLTPDLAAWPGGDATEIGERGVNLSGGQRARVALARSLYSNAADIYILDDPLSALDVHVAGHVFRDGIQALLHDKIVLVAINSHYHLLPMADTILVMEQGRLVAQGPLSSLLDRFPHLGVDRIDEKQPTTAQVETTDDDNDVAPPNEGDEGGSAAAAVSALVEAEERVVGKITAATYTTYFAASGWNGFSGALTVVIAFALAQASLVVLDWILGYWASAADPSNAAFAAIYVAVAVVAVGLVLGRSLYVLHFILLCSKHLHETLLAKVVYAPVPSFFDVTPVGRILNRFSSDLSQVDNMVPMLGLHIFGLVFQIVAALVVCAVTSPFILLVYVPLAVVFVKIRAIYSATATALKRMESVTRSPVLNLLTEAMQGAPTIRAFDHAADVQALYRRAVDYNMSFDMTHFISTKWFQMRLDWLSVLVVCGVAFLAIETKSWMGVTAAGLALTYAMQLTIVLSRTTMEFTYMENVMTSAQRLDHYQSLAKEGHDDVLSLAQQQTCPQGWPRQGHVVFEHYSMRYRDNLDLALHDVSFAVMAGEKIGICGRTGSGKSSLLAALFRTVEAASGCICIDGVDIATVDLHTLRSRLTIIPQDPVLFSGSLRFNLDPSMKTSDAALWQALKQVHLVDLVQEGQAAGLEFPIAEHGSNLSVGERQLLCMARALLRQSRVVVFDEATASIDGESDRLIQATIQKNFQGGGVTLLVIAHRLETILDSDRILVMDQGRVCEFDTPATLMAANEGSGGGGGMLAKLVEATKL